MTHSVLDNLPLWQLLLVGACFCWSGFVRSGLGFGGAALTLPLLLVFENDPLIFLPALGFQLLFFSLLTVATRFGNIDWMFLFKLVAALIIPFSIGMFGLLSLPGELLTGMVYVVTLIYGFSYLLNRAFSSDNRISDVIFIGLGGYASGVSLIGAPLIVAAAARYVAKEKMRDTFFVLWIFMVILKLSTFVAAEVNMQWRLALLSFPLAAIGHYFGLKAHKLIMTGNKGLFERVIGSGLVFVSLFGLSSLLLKWLGTQ